MNDVPSEASRLIGAVLNGRYRLEQLLGEGGVGAVFRATHLGNGAAMAVKVLHPELRDNAQVVERFFDEAAIVTRLRHPGIVQIFEANRAEDGTPYLAMELLVGRPLSVAMQMSGALPVSFVATLLQGALEALDFAHRSGVVHRDLKPDNLFVLTPPGAPPALKIVDFGIAKVMDAAGGMGTRTRTGMLLGTPSYMSPEQLLNSKAVDPRSDLWSMAIVVYEMLTGGHEAFPADNPMQQISLMLNGSPAPITSANPSLASLQPFFDRALARDPSRRYQTAQSMAEAIGAFARHFETGERVPDHLLPLLTPTKPPPAALPTPLAQPVPDYLLAIAPAGLINPPPSVHAPPPASVHAPPPASVHAPQPPPPGAHPSRPPPPSFANQPSYAGPGAFANQPSYAGPPGPFANQPSVAGPPPGAFANQPSYAGPGAFADPGSMVGPPSVAGPPGSVPAPTSYYTEATPMPAPPATRKRGLIIAGIIVTVLLLIAVVLWLVLS